MLERKTIFAAISLIHNRFVCYLSSILHLLTWNSLLIWYNKGPYILLLYQSSFETIIKWNFSFHEIVFCLLQNIWESEREWDKKNTQKNEIQEKKNFVVEIRTVERWKKISWVCGSVPLLFIFVIQQDFVKVFCLWVLQRKHFIVCSLDSFQFLLSLQSSSSLLYYHSHRGETIISTTVKY